MAFKLPNLLRRIFCRRRVLAGFCAGAGRIQRKQGEDAARALLANVAGVLTLALAAVTALGMLAAPWVIYLSAPGFGGDGDKFALTVTLRITFPYILLISLASRWPASVLNTWRQFSIPAFTPTC